MKNEKGFTLVELMVVVAIIGLLSAVAIPNFKKYQAKSKMSEAKLQLSAIYAAEATYFTSYDMYHNCLGTMGYDPGPEAANRYYAVGFNIDATTVTNAYNTAVNSGLNTADCPQANTANPGNVGSSSANRSTWFPAGKGIGSTVASSAGYLTNTDLGDQSSVANIFYVAGAGGIISQEFTSAGSSSMLTINQNKIRRT